MYLKLHKGCPLLISQIKKTSMLQVSAAEEQRPVIAVLSRSSTKGDVITVVPEEDTIDHGVL